MVVSSSDDAEDEVPRGRRGLLGSVQLSRMLQVMGPWAEHVRGVGYFLSLHGYFLSPCHKFSKQSVQHMMESLQMSTAGLKRMRVLACACCLMDKCCQMPPPPSHVQNTCAPPCSITKLLSAYSPRFVDAPLQHKKRGHGATLALMECDCRGDALGSLPPDLTELFFK